MLTGSIAMSTLGAQSHVAALGGDAHAALARLEPQVVTAQNSALQAQLASVAIQLRRMAASVLLVKALGGGWNAAQIRSADERERRDAGTATMPR